MGKLAELEREHVWGGVFGVAKGSSRESARRNFRPAIYRPRLASRLAGLALTREFKGDTLTDQSAKKAKNPFARRHWPTAAVIIPEPLSWDKLLEENPDGEVMVIAVPQGKKIAMVGSLASREAVGTYRQHSGEELAAHAMRIGGENVRFGLGIVDPDGQIQTPDDYLPIQDVPMTDAIKTGWILLSQIGQPGRPFEHTYVS